MTDIEELFKLKNWLSVLTYDAFQYANRGGLVTVGWTKDRLTIELLGVNLETEGINTKFKRYAESMTEDINQPPEAPAPIAAANPNGEDKND